MSVDGVPHHLCDRCKQFKPMVARWKESLKTVIACMGCLEYFCNGCSSIMPISHPEGFCNLCMVINRERCEAHGCGGCDVCDRGNAL